MISNRCIYALKAMLELAKREGAGPVTIAEIAASQDIPVRFLEAILRQLKQSGFTESQRGKDGGYALARDARSIRMGDIVRVFEDPIAAGNPPDGRENGPSIFCEVWTDAQRALNAVYDRHTFRDLAERDKALHSQKAHDYSI